MHPDKRIRKAKSRGKIQNITHKHQWKIIFYYLRGQFWLLEALFCARGQFLLRIEWFIKFVIRYYFTGFHDPSTDLHAKSLGQSLRPRLNFELFLRRNKLGELRSWKVRLLAQLSSSEWVWIVQHVLSVCFRRIERLKIVYETNVDLTFDKLN